MFSEECMEQSITIMNKVLSYNFSLYPPASSSSFSGGAILKSSASLKSHDEDINGVRDDEGEEDGHQEDGNFLSFLDKTSSSPRSRGGGDKGSGIVSIPKKMMAEMTRHIYPLVRTHLSCLAYIFSYGPQRQHEHLCIITYELAFAILRTKISAPGNGSVNLISLPSSTLLLMETALPLLSRLYTQYPSCRSNILDEVYPFLAQCYTHPKNHPKAFTLPLTEISRDNLATCLGDGSGEGSVSHLREELSVSSPYATAGYALVITLFQGLIGQSNPPPNYDNNTIVAVSVSSESSKEQVLENLLALHRQHMQDCYSALSSFVKGLLKRCAHKETSGSYRETLNELILELVSLVSPAAGDCSSSCAGSQLLSPSCPIAPLLLNQILTNMVGEIMPCLQSSANVSTGAGLATSYLNFLIDVLGGLGCKLRDVVLMAEEEQENAEGSVELELSAGKGS
jgi:hypothetical protein